MTQEEYRIKSLLYDAIVELAYIQDVENCHSGLCATGQGKHIVETGMKLLGVKDLSAEKWNQIERPPA